MNIEFLKKYLSDLAEAGSIPNIGFKIGSNLYSNTVGIMGVTNNEDKTDAELIDQWLSNIDPENLEKLEATISNMSKSFQSRLIDGLDILKELKATVATLDDEIEKEYTKRLALDPKLAKAIANKNVEYKYEVYDFSSVNNVGNKNTLADAIEALTIGSADLTKDHKFNISIAKYLNKVLEGVQVKTTVLDDEFRKSIVDKVVADNDKFNPDSVKNALHFITNINCNRILFEAKKMLDDNPMVDKVIYWAMGLLNEYSETVSAVESELLKNDVSNDNIGDNVKILNAVLEICAYYVNYHRDTTLSDTVLLSNNTRNPDTIKKAEEAGITDEDIAKHHVTLLKEIPLSKKGLTITKILDIKERVEKILTEVVEEDEKYIALKEKEIYKNTAIVIVYNYINSFVGKDLYEEVELSIGKNNLKDIPIQTTIYNILINVLHKDTIVEMLYSELGYSYIELLDNNKDVTEDMINDSNIETYTRIITNFICTFFIS